MSPPPTPPTNWIPLTESRYPWEREALEFIRQRFPTHEPYRAWSNFEFIADDGSVNEVDLLVFTPHGFFLVEIKSRPGRLSGDAGTWTWETDGRLATMDNPLFAANAKAKKLKALLDRQRACQRDRRPPFIEALVFCSDPHLDCRLLDTALYHVCLRDREREGDRPARAGILAALLGRTGAGLEPNPRGTFDRVTLRAVSQALDQAGIRPSQRQRQVGDFTLERLLGEGPGYQDWEGVHVQLPEVKRRVRLYLVRTRAAAEERATIERAARREFQLLEALQHPGIPRVYHFTGHELGPALILEHDPRAVRLDHFLAERRESLSIDDRLGLMRRIAEVIRFAHDRKVIHRALSPAAILVSASAAGPLRVQVGSWQAGSRTGGPEAGVSREVTPTSHPDRLVDDASTAYLAPEALAGDGPPGEHLDVFSLGALAYHLFSGEPPAANGLELGDRLRETSGLRISATLNGAGDWLQALVQESTHPVVPNRLDSAAEFLSYLDNVEDELTTPDRETHPDPAQAQKGDQLPGGYRVLRRLGQGAAAVALLVQRGGEDFVLKAASSPEQNERVRQEAEVIKKLRHPNVVECCGEVAIGEHAAFLMRPVLVDREARRVETLGQRLRREGRLHVDLLQRFGEDLLSIVDHLEEQGIPHRDLKPDNIALGMVGRGSRLHLVLFDFSLSRAPVENIRAGTPGYLEPLLPLRTPPRWDLHAERYAAAVTLYEMATGALPRWGDGRSDPAQLDGEITLDAELFDAALREPLAAFFRRALRREPAERFDHAEEMLREWRLCFEGIEQPGALSDHEGESLLALLAPATHDTPLAELGLGTRATNALDRANLLTVGQLLAIPTRRLMRLRGVGNQTRREILDAVRILRPRLGTPSPSQVPTGAVSDPTSEPAEAGPPGIDSLLLRVLEAGETAPAARALNALLGLDRLDGDLWPAQADVARRLSVTRARIGQLMAGFQERWRDDRPLTRLREEIVELLQRAGGVMTPAELAAALLMALGSLHDEPQRTRGALAVARAALEAERLDTAPRFLVRRERERLFVALAADRAAYAARLGDCADRLADEDPLLPPIRALEQLRAVALPQGAEPLGEARLLRLAVAAARRAALSSRHEVYPRGMEPARALKLAQSALYRVRCLTAAQVKERVASRYPDAAPLPGRPALDDLLAAAGVPFAWDPEARPAGVETPGCYVSRAFAAPSVSGGSEPLARRGTGPAALPPGDLSPEVAAAREFEERLQRGLREGSFLALLVSSSHYQDACRELARRFSLEVVDLEDRFLAALRQAAEQAKVDWDLVVRTDTSPGQGDWRHLLTLVGRALPLVEAPLLAARRPLLLTYAGLLARYDRMDLLERLRDQAGRRDGLPAVWLLLPGGEQATIDGKAVPLLSPAQRAHVPRGWLENRHRAGAEGGE